MSHSVKTDNKCQQVKRKSLSKQTSSDMYFGLLLETLIVLEEMHLWHLILKVVHLYVRKIFVVTQKQIILWVGSNKKKLISFVKFLQSSPNAVLVYSCCSRTQDRCIFHSRVLNLSI